MSTNTSSDRAERWRDEIDFPLSRAADLVSA